MNSGLVLAIAALTGDAEAIELRQERLKQLLRGGCAGQFDVGARHLYYVLAGHRGAANIRAGDDDNFLSRSGREIRGFIFRVGSVTQYDGVAMVLYNRQAGSRKQKLQSFARRMTACYAGCFPAV